MRLSALFFVMLTAHLPAYSHHSFLPSSNVDTHSVRSHRTLDNSVIASPDLIRERGKNLRKMSSSATNDSLIHWQQLYGPFGSAVRCFVRAPNGAILFCSEVGIYRLKSFGAAWEKLVLPKSFNSSAILTMFVHPSGAIIAGGENQIFRSTDNGETWSETDINAVFDQFAVDSSGKLYTASYDAGVLFSADTGRTWSVIGLPHKELASLVVTKTGKLICGSMNAIYTSVDNGASWDSAKVGYGPFFWLAKDSTGTLYALADSYLFRLTDNSSTWKLRTHDLLLIYSIQKYNLSSL